MVEKTASPVSIRPDPARTGISHTPSSGKTSVYWGESHRTWWDRSREHHQALLSGNKSYAIVKHQEIHHPESTPNFTFKLNKSWPSSLQRQIWEAMMIENTPTHELMNSRSEYGGNSIPRVSIQQFNDRQDKHDRHDHNQEDPGQASTSGSPSEHPNDRPGKRSSADSASAKYSTSQENKRPKVQSLMIFSSSKCEVPKQHTCVK